MPILGTFLIGHQYEIRVDSAPASPGSSALVFGWVPNPGLPPTTPVVDLIPPGIGRLHAGVVPSAQMMILEVDLPNGPNASVTITVSQDGAPIKSEVMTNDFRWLFSV